jgi:O-acetyl-ADP-ribose deacetylase (regulator of RNase III)
MNINYVKGDATRPQGQGNKIICHICNDIGAWGAGFVLAISKRWSYPEQFYRARQSYPEGHVDVLKVDTDDSGDIFVANMIAQHGTRFSGKGLHSLPPIRYTWLAKALEKVNRVAVEQNATLHMPRIGCGLAGGDWEAVEAVIRDVVTVDVIVYDFE